MHTVCVLGAEDSVGEQTIFYLPSWSFQLVGKVDIRQIIAQPHKLVQIMMLGRKSQEC